MSGPELPERAGLVALVEARPLGTLEAEEILRVERALHEDPELAEESAALEGAYALWDDAVSRELETLWSSDLEERILASAAQVAPKPEAAEPDKISAEPQAPSPAELGVRLHLTCIYCHAAADREEALFCASCLAPHHEECFATHGRCSAPGCDETHGVRPTEPTLPPPPAPLPTRRLALPWALSLVCAGVAAVALVEFLPSRLISPLDGAGQQLWTSLALDLEENEARLERAELALDERRPAEARKGASEVLVRLDASALRLPSAEAPAQEPAAKTRRELRKQRVRALVLRARAALADPDQTTLEGAAVDLERVLAWKGGLAPDDAPAHVARGQLLTLEGSLDRARAEFEEALELMPNSVRARCGAAQVHVLQEEPGEAIRALASALRTLNGREPTPEGPGLQVEVLSDLQRVRLREQIMTCYARAKLLPPGPSVRAAIAAFESALEGGWLSLSLKGAALAQRGQIFQALPHFERAIEASRASGRRAEAKAQCALSEGYLACDLPAAAEHAAAKASELDAANLLAPVLRAEAREFLYDDEEARELASRVVASAKGLRGHWKEASRAFRLLARQEAAHGNLPEAREFAKRALDSDEESLDNRVLLARLEADDYFDGQYLESAERHIRSALRQRPSPAVLRVQALIDLQMFTNDPARAERRLLQAMKLDPGDPWTRALLAKTYLELAKRVPAESERYQRRAAKLWDRSLRQEHDLRRPSGGAYAEGLRLEKLAFGGKEPILSAAVKAQRAYQRALWLCPTHTQARAGLVRIGVYLRTWKRVAALLKAGRSATPRSFELRALHALHLARGEDSRAALAAIQLAREGHGETVELELARIFHEHLGHPSAEAALNAKRARETARGLALLRKRDPLSLELRRREVALLWLLIGSARRRGKAHVEEAGVLVQARETARAGLEALERELVTRAAQARELWARAEEALAKGDPLGAVEPAQLAVRADPRGAAAWAALARALRQADDSWGALVAGLRAAWLDDRHLALTLPLLRSVGAEPLDPSELASSLQASHDIYPLPRDLRVLMESAPLVARALVVEGAQDRPEFRDEAKAAFETLEGVVARDPSRLLTHGLLGTLAFAVERDDYALQHLLLVAHLQPGIGEFAYLAAAASSRHPKGERRRNDTLAILCLQAATRAGFDWETRSLSEPGLLRLRRDAEFWGALQRDLRADPPGPR